MNAASKKVCDIYPGSFLGFAYTIVVVRVGSKNAGTSQVVGRGSIHSHGHQSRQPNPYKESPHFIHFGWILEPTRPHNRIEPAVWVGRSPVLGRQLVQHNDRQRYREHDCAVHDPSTPHLGVSFFSVLRHQL